MCQFSVKMDNFEFLAKFLPNYMQSFGSTDIARSWVEAEMSWVEVNGAGRRWMKLGGVGCTV